MNYLIYGYICGAVVMLIMALHAMSTPYATQKEVQAMCYNHTSALGNFVGNIFALLVIAAFWPVVAALAIYKTVRGK